MAEAIAMTVERNDEGRPTAEVWPLPIADDKLEELLRDLFGNHWDKLTFGPMLQGGAYELRCPGEPQSITVSGGYFTVHWGKGGHVHLCIGESSGSPELIAHRRPSKAELVRGLDKEGLPVTWSLRVENGKGESTLAIFFPNPFITSDDKLADAPDWSRLELWHHVLGTYAGTVPDGRDTASKGFRH